MPKAEHFTEKLTIFIRTYTHTEVLVEERFNQKVKINIRFVWQLHKLKQTLVECLNTSPTS